MSATATSLPSQPIPFEPFGQAGVRQYMGRALAWLCITVSLSAAAMTQRSSNFFDNLQWIGQGEALQIVSVGGTLSLYGGPTRQKSTNTGWKYGGAYMGQIGRYARFKPWNRGWSSEMSGLVGIEARALAADRDFDSGVFFRIKWPTLAALFMVQPLGYVLIRLRRRRAEARDAG